MSAFPPILAVALILLAGCTPQDSNSPATGSPSGTPSSGQLAVPSAGELANAQRVTVFSGRGTALGNLSVVTVEPNCGFLPTGFDSAPRSVEVAGGGRVAIGFHLNSQRCSRTATDRSIPYAFTTEAFVLPNVWVFDATTVAGANLRCVVARTSFAGNCSPRA